MEIAEQYTLHQLGFYINFGFPPIERNNLVAAVMKVQLNGQKEIQKSLDGELEKLLKADGWERNKKLWQPEFRHNVDLYNETHKIAIEIEKSEKKRVVHDILKLVNGSNTFVPKVKFGVLIIPDYYIVRNRKTPFASTAKQDLRFYFGNIIPARTNIQDILTIVYKVDKT